jgi:hypothetical protein
MKNPFTAAEQDLIKAGKWIAGDVSKVEQLITAEKKLAPDTVTKVVKFVTDAQTLISLSATAAGGEGLNFAADSAAYQAFLEFKDDVVALAAQIEADVKAL